MTHVRRYYRIHDKNEKFMYKIAREQIFDLGFDTANADLTWQPRNIQHIQRLWKYSTQFYLNSIISRV